MSKFLTADQAARDDWFVRLCALWERDGRAPAALADYCTRVGLDRWYYAVHWARRRRKVPMATGDTSWAWTPWHTGGGSSGIAVKDVGYGDHPSFAHAVVALLTHWCPDEPV